MYGLCLCIVHWGMNKIMWRAISSHGACNTPRLMMKASRQVVSITMTDEFLQKILVEGN